MTRPMNYVDNGFSKLIPHVFISNDIEWDKSDGSAKVTKWISDYLQESPHKETTYFTQTERTNGEGPWHPFFIHRYTNIDRFIEDVSDKKITFLSPKLWDDPFESNFYNDKLKIDKKDIDIRCICSTYDCVYNEEAAWNRAANRDYTVRVAYNFKEYCEMLSGIGQENKMDFYLSVADYSQSKNQMVISNVKDEYTDIGKYIKLLSLKRKAFAYENELRIFAVFGEPKSPLNDVESFKLCNKSYEEIIKHITLPPLQPNKSINKVCDYDKLQEAKNKPLRDLLEKYVPKEKIQESRLYSIKK